MERLNREVVRGWEANCEADEIMEAAPDAAPKRMLLTDKDDRRQHPQDDAPAPRAADTPMRSKFDEQEDD